MAGQITLTVAPELDGERLDRVLAATLQVSRAEARALIEAGVHVEGLPGKPSDRVAVGMEIRSPEPSAPAGLEPEEIPFETLFEDESVIVVNKPPGLVVHPGSGRSSGTLAAGLLFRYPEIEGVGSPGRWGLVHRLDRDTSGALLVARSADAYRSLRDQMIGREVTRVYLALVHGTFAIPTGTVEAPIGRDPARPTRRAVVPGGKEARTHYQVLTNYPSSDVSLLEVRLETGRTHQIRVHMSAIGHPVVGDRTYDPKPSKLPSPRVFLHAHRLSFSHPISGELLEVEAPLPVDLEGVLARTAE